MTREPDTGPRPGFRPGRIAAAGFDLDHTLAVYDDRYVNALAWNETRERLVAQALPGAAELPAAYPHAGVVRGLLLDLSRGSVCKTDASNRVVLERPPGASSPRPPAGPRLLAPGYPASHVTGSAFDLVTAALFAALAGAAKPHPGAYRSLCASVRTALDLSHTRGRLKEEILANLDRALLPARIEPAHLQTLRERGCRLFVLTNSGPEYTIALLDHLFAAPGMPRWSEVFCAVFAAARKPDFFDGDRVPERIDQVGMCNVYAGGCAAALEVTLEASGKHVFYAGDHPVHDVVPSARRGWTTAAIVPECAACPPTGPWGHPLRAGTNGSWLSAAIGTAADVEADRAGALLGALAGACAVPPPASSPGDSR